MTGYLAGLATAAPQHDAPQKEAAELHAHLSGLDEARARTLRALYRRSGVERRGSVLLERAEGRLADRQSFYARIRDEGDLGPSTADRMARYERHAPVLAAEASRRALADAGVAASELTHVVTVSCTGFVAPGIDARLVEHLGLARDVTRTHVGFMGCHGALNGIRVAHGLVRAEPSATVLVCAVELCSLHFAYGWDPETLVANALFADGSGALVLRGEAAGADAPDGREGWRVAATGTVLLEGCGGDMTWRIGDHGFRMTLSARVPELIERELRGWLEGWLAEQGVALPDVATWAVHPGGPRILGAVESALSLEAGRSAESRAVLRAHGNMSSATILFILQRLRARAAPRPCVALAFGPGLVAEVLLLR